MLRTRLELAQLHQRKKCMYMQSYKVHLYVSSDL